MIKKAIFLSFFFLQCGYSYTQIKDSVKIYSGTIKLKNESPFPQTPEFRKVIFTLMGDQSTLELINYFSDLNGEKTVISTENMKIDKIENGLYIFKPSNINFQLCIKAKKKYSVLIIKRVKKGPIIKKRKKKVKLRVG